MHGDEPYSDHQSLIVHTGIGNTIHSVNMPWQLNMAYQNLLVNQLTFDCITLLRVSYFSLCVAISPDPCLTSYFLTQCLSKCVVDCLIRPSVIGSWSWFNRRCYRLRHFQSLTSCQQNVINLLICSPLWWYTSLILGMVFMITVNCIHSSCMQNIIYINYYSKLDHY